MFVGRERELSVLRRAYEQGRSAFVPVYGRRRVGKTELIRHLLDELPGVYSVGKEAPAALQQRELLEAAAVALGRPLLAQVQTGSWRDVLRAVVREAPGKIVLALDEFQWSAGASPELPSVLQALWDGEWSRDNRVLLILCGSYVGFMEREVLGAKSPLFGRRTAQIHLQPFGAREARGFHPEWSLTEVARVRFVCGGVPAYLEAFDATRSVEQSLVELVLDELGPLRREPDFLLREELREIQSYYAILMAIATGSLRVRDIAAQTGLAERSLPYYLNQLLDLGYLRRAYPLTGGKPVARHVRYQVADPLLRFWFRFVWPHQSLLAQQGPQAFFDAHVRPQLPAFFGEGFEALCRELLPTLLTEEGVRAGVEVGEYWSRDVQLDVVGLRDDGWTELGECKWGSVKRPSTVAADLKRRAARFPNPRGATLSYRLFSRERSKVEGVRSHDLPDLYDATG